MVMLMNRTESYEIKLLKSAIQYAKKRAQKNSTHSSLHRSEIKKVKTKIDMLRSEEKNQYRPFSRIFNDNFEISDSDIEDLRRNHALTKKYQVGNCSEQSYLVAKFLRKHNMSCEIISFIHHDHVFVVLYRDPQSDLDDPSTWGEQAIICDPLNNLIFSASEYREKLKGHSYNEITSRNYPNINIDYDSMDDIGLHIEYKGYEQFEYQKNMIQLAQLKLKKFNSLLASLDDKYPIQDDLLESKKRKVTINNINKLIKNFMQSIKKNSFTSVGPTGHLIERKYHKLINKITSMTREIFKDHEILSTLSIHNQQDAIHNDRKEDVSFIQKAIQYCTKEEIIRILDALSNEEFSRVLLETNKNNDSGFYYLISKYPELVKSALNKINNFMNIVYLLSLENGFLQNILQRGEDNITNTILVELVQYIKINNDKVKKDSKTAKKLYYIIEDLISQQNISPENVSLALKILEQLSQNHQDFFRFSNKVLHDGNNLLQLILFQNTKKYDKYLYEIIERFSPKELVKLLCHKNNKGSNAFEIAVEKHMTVFLTKLFEKLGKEPNSKKRIEYLTVFDQYKKKIVPTHPIHKNIFFTHQIKNINHNKNKCNQHIISKPNKFSK